MGERDAFVSHPEPAVSLVTAGNDRVDAEAHLVSPDASAVG
jgi:hypothetical protein